jgi:hypothetical protein
MGTIGNLVHLVHKAHPSDRAFNKAATRATDISMQSHQSKLLSKLSGTGLPVLIRHQRPFLPRSVSLHLDDLSSRGDLKVNATGTDYVSQQFRSFALYLNDPMKPQSQMKKVPRRLVILMPAALSKIHTRALNGGEKCHRRWGGSLVEGAGYLPSRGSTKRIITIALRSMHRWGTQVASRANPNVGRSAYLSPCTVHIDTLA